ncbi:MAG: GPW/gp25 family protein [Lachnospiraceae bacterium]|nr:GPW/gp25 family protein [Lachnospiraceae bacterium]
MQETDNELEFLGTGMQFPPAIDRATGRLQTVSGRESVRQAVWLILMTQLTERPMRPEFGTNLMGFTFMEMNHTVLNMAIRTLKEQILMQEPRVGSVEISAEEGGSGMLLFRIDYTVRNSNVRDNFVFPFYLQGEPENTETEEEVFEPESLEETDD